MKCSFKSLALLAVLFVTACGNPHVQEARQWVREVYYGPPKPPPDYSVREQDERWCYGTLGAMECYQKPQSLPVESLVAVYPNAKFPHTREDYEKVLAEKEAQERAQAKAKARAKAEAQAKIEAEKAKEKAQKEALIPQAAQPPQNIKTLMAPTSSKP